MIGYWLMQAFLTTIAALLVLMALSHLDGDVLKAWLYLLLAFGVGCLIERTHGMYYRD